MSEQRITWSGWIWAEGERAWRRVCTGATLAETSAELEKARGTTPGYLCVVTGGKPPTWTPRFGNSSR